MAKIPSDSNVKSDAGRKSLREVTEVAYNVLSDPEKKKLYDQFGHGI